MDISILKKLNLNEKEIKVYLKLLEYGAISIRSLAELTDLNRGTTYDILKRLQELGLVSFYHQDTKQRFVAEDPEKLIKLLSKREEEIREARERVEEIIPELKSLQDKGGNKPVTKFYEGKEGVKFILEDVLSSMKDTKLGEYYVYSALGVREDVYTAYPDFNKKRIKAEIKVKTISLSHGGKTYGADERKWLNPEEKNSAKDKVEAKSNGQAEPPTNMTYILIYADKCAFISRDARNNPVGVIIENKMIYETQRIIFLKLWGGLK